jgi:hypothetical protein
MRVSFLAVFAAITFAKVVFQVFPAPSAISDSSPFGSRIWSGWVSFHLVVDLAPMPAGLAAVFVLMVTVPLNFFGSRLAIGASRPLSHPVDLRGGSRPDARRRSLSRRRVHAS